MEAHKLAAIYLGLAGLLIAVFAHSFSNNAAAPKLSWMGLSQARVGLYHRASATKQISTAAFVDSNETLQGSFLERLGNAARSGNLTFHQRAKCIQNTYAKGCNLPYGELSLGLAFGLSLFALSSALVLWLSRTHAWLLPSSVIVSALFCALAFGWLEQTRLPAGSFLARLHTLEVGVYKNLESPLIKPDPSDPEWVEKLSHRALQSRSYCRLPAFTTNCGVTVLEMPLSLPFFFSLGCLLGSGFIVLTTVIRATTQRSSNPALRLGQDET